MKIGFFTDTYWPKIDGVVISINLLKNELEKLGHEVFVICPKYDIENEDDPTIIRVKGFDPMMSMVGFNSHIARGAASDVRRIRKLNLDIVHTHTQFNAGLMGVRVARRNQIPHVSTYHTNLNALIDFFPGIFHLSTFFVAGIMSYHMKQINPLKTYVRHIKPTRLALTKRVDSFLRLYFNETSAVVANSDHMQDYLESIGVKTRIELIKNGIDLDKFAPKPRQNTDEPNIALVSRLNPEKRQDIAIMAIAELERRGISVRLHIAGEGPHEKFCKNLAKEIGVSDKVEFHGPMKQAEVRKLLSDCDLGLLTSFQFDTYPLSVMEYLASGIGVIYCDRNFKDMGTSGSMMLAQPTAKSFADKIEEIVENKKIRELGLQAVKDAKRHDVTEKAKFLASLYEELIDRRHLSEESQTQAQSNIHAKDQA